LPNYFTRTDGIVTLEDLVEAIVGDIEDEHDEIEAGIKRVTSPTGLLVWEADARTSIDDFEVSLGRDFATADQEDEADTLGTYVQVGDTQSLMTGDTVSSTLPPVLFARRWKGRLLDFGLGALSVLSLAPFHIWPIPYRTAFGRGFLFGLGYFLCGTYWISSAFIARGPEFVPLMPPMILGLAVLLASFWGAASVIYYRLRAPLWASGLAFAAIFTLAEITRGHILGGFPWNLPGYIFKAGGMVSQSASVIGIYGLQQDGCGSTQPRLIW